MVKNKTICRNCGAVVGKSENVCYRCGHKLKNPVRTFFKILLITTSIPAALFVLLVFIALLTQHTPSEPPEPETFQTTPETNPPETKPETLQQETTKDGPTYNPATIREQCTEAPYEDIARNPDEYIFEKIKFTGEVWQVTEAGENHVVLMVQQDNADSWYIWYDRPDGESRILEGDRITCYGFCYGLIDYKSIGGRQITVPSMYMVAYDQNT